MNKSQILPIIQESLLSVTRKIEKTMGVLYCMQNRNKFEKWLQVEFLGELMRRTHEINSLDVKMEEEFGQKQSKKGDTIDIAVLKDMHKFMGIELKVIPTNYHVDGFTHRGPKAITSGISAMITDLQKTAVDGYEVSVSIGFVFPFPSSSSHRNFNDFKRQKHKLSKAGNVIEKGHSFLINIPKFKAEFQSFQYILWKDNVAVKPESQKAA